MSFPFLIAIGLPLFLSPVLTHHIFASAYAWQSAQISLDNAAIQTGRSDRDLFNSVRALNKIIRGLEVPHHVMHLCARSGNPYTAAACAPGDAAFEAQIRVLHQTVWQTASVWWMKTSLQARLSVLQLDPVGSIERDSTVPLKSTQCPVCGLDTEWEKSEDTIETAFHISKPRDLSVKESIKGSSLRFGDKWDYELGSGEREVE